MKYMKLILLSFALSQIYFVSALNVLAIVSLPLKSHYMSFQTLFYELSFRGHSVTVINNYPDKNPPKNLSFIYMNASQRHNFTALSEFEKFNSFLSVFFNFYAHFTNGPKYTKEDCESFFANENITAIRDKKDKFDVIFVEQFVSDCGLVYAAMFCDAPIIGITSHTLLPWAYTRLGIPFDVGSDAFYFSYAGTNPPLYKKFESFLMNIYADTIGRWQYNSVIYQVFNEYLPNTTFDVERIAKERMVMMFSNQHHSVTGARLLAPRVLEIGGMHIKKSNIIPESIQNFLSTAEHGVVYVSFGSNLKASTMSKYKFQHFLDAFRKIPQKVLLKLDNTTLPPGNDHIFVHEWFPQVDILCHPKVLAFISHGGMLSVSEAAHCGKPLFAIPFFGDQFSNAAAVVDSGLGLTMHFKNLNAENLADAIKKLLSSKMQKNAKRVSTLWHDRPMNVIDSAIYWTEYVARHKDVPSLPTTNKSWFQSSLLDVYSVLFVILIMLYLIIYNILKIVYLVTVMLMSLLLTKEIKDKKKRA